jgi:hypothetical protein
LRLQCGMPCSKLEVSTVQHGTLSGAGYLHQSHMDHFRQSDLPKNSIRSLSLLSEVSVLAVAFQKISKRDRHAPRSHINHMLPIKTADEVPAKVVQICIEDDRDPCRPLFVVAKNHTVANYGDILARLRIDNIAVEHIFSVLRVRCDAYNSEFVALFLLPCYCPRMPRKRCAYPIRRSGADDHHDLRGVQSARALQCGNHGAVQRREDADLLAGLANCPKTGSASIYDRCKAVYEKPPP